MYRHVTPKLNALLVKAVVFGCGASSAMMVVAAPATTLRALADGVGLPGILPVVNAPLFAAVRFLLALLTGGFVSAILWGVAWVDPSRPRWQKIGATRWRRQGATQAPIAEDVPVVRRADAHPDAPARRPVHAGAELGAPLAIDPDTQDAPAENAIDLQDYQRVPVDLNQPLAAFDPIALTDAAPTLEPTDAIAEPVSPEPVGSIEETLGMLRRLAAG